MTKRILAAALAVVACLPSAPVAEAQEQSLDTLLEKTRKAFGLPALLPPS